MDYDSLECPIDFPAMIREHILNDVRTQGKADLCSAEASTAFAGWDHSQIELWCDQNDVAIIARHDGRIIICQANVNNLQLHGITVDEAQILATQQLETHRIRAEVEAMDWPEVIGE